MIHFTLFAFLYLFASDHYLNPVEIQDLVHSGLELVYVEKYDAAQAYFDTIIQLDPENPAGYFFSAGLLQLKMIDECRYTHEEEYLSFMRKTIKYAEKILENEENIWAEFYLGSSYINRALYEGFKDNAFEAFKSSLKGGRILQDIIKKDSTFYDAYFGAGTSEYFWARVTRYIPILRLAHGKVDEAIRKLHIAAEKSIYSKPMSENVLAYIYGEEGKFSKADSTIDHLLTQYPESRTFLWSKAKLEFKKENYAYAADLYSNLFAIYDSHNTKNYANLAQCKFLIGKCFYELGERDKAKQALKEVITYKQYSNEYPVIKDYCREAYGLLSRML